MMDAIQDFITESQVIAKEAQKTAQLGIASTQQGIATIERLQEKEDQDAAELHAVIEKEASEGRGLH
jgi:hypothetical protein